MQNHPVYSIGVVSELLGVHPETVRTWEKSGVVEPPQRRSGKRFYSEMDYKRLQFVHKLTREGLTLRALHYYLRLYPCWKTSACPGCLYNSVQVGSTKLCWQDVNTFCQVVSNKNPCLDCHPDAEPGRSKPTAAKRNNATQRSGHQESELGLYSEVGAETADDTLTLSPGHRGATADD